MLKCSDLKNEYFESYDLQICFREKQVLKEQYANENNIIKLIVIKHTEKKSEINEFTNLVQQYKLKDIFQSQIWCDVFTP